ncbi:MAG TPA: histidine kinase [Gammaproteobacteria bacterium]|nr:histidine kinase [Gammaproteobacteria bacterium]
MASSRGAQPQASVGAELDDRIFRMHFERLPGPAYIWQRDGEDFRLIAHNSAGAQVGPTPIGPLVGTLASRLEFERGEILDHLHACADSATVQRRESDATFADGVVRSLAITCIPLSRDTVVVHLEDVTERRRAGRELEESEGRLRALFASHPDVVFRMDADATFLDLHVPEANFFPWKRDELIGRTVGSFFGKDAQESQIRHNLEAIRTGNVQVFEYRLPLADGSSLDLESRVARSGGNEVVVTVRDISDRVELERRVTVSGERERNRLGREIHDGLAQMLTGVKLLLERLEKRLQQDKSPLAVEAGQATELINGTIAHARELVRGLSPIPEDNSLFKALELLATHSQKYLGLSCRTKLRGNPERLGEVAVVHLYRIAQEAVTNAARHGRARSVEIGCEICPTDLSLTISDDGSGYDESSADADGLGLKIMRQRARALSGQVAIARNSEGGTLVSCTCQPFGLDGAARSTRRLD